MHRYVMDGLNVLLVVGGLAFMYGFMRFFTVKSGGRISEEGFGQALGDREWRKRETGNTSPQSH